MTNSEALDEFNEHLAAMVMWATSAAAETEPTAQEVAAECSEVVDRVRGNRSVKAAMSHADIKLLLLAFHRRCLGILGES